MSDVLESIGSLAGPSAYLVVGVLALLEASAFVGLFVPGELAVLIGGYITYEGRAELVPMMIVAVVGAIVGDSIGYEIGRHLGGSIRRSRFGRRVGEERWARAEHYLMTRGGRAVFFGRFIGVLRALVPALAGVSRLPYRKFLFWNALGALIWAPSLVMAGYLAGGSYRRVEHVAGRAGLVLLVLILMIGSVAALGRWVSQNPERVRAIGRSIMERPLPSRLYRRYRAQLDFAVNRLKPGQVLGLALTLQLIVLGLAGWAFGALTQDVVSGRGATSVDMPISRALLERRVDWLTTTMGGVTDLGGGMVLGIGVVLVGLLVWRLKKNWVPVAVLGAAFLGAAILGDAVKPLVGRDRPPLLGGQLEEGYAFPSAHATRAIAVYGALAYVAMGWLRTWSARVAAWTIALVVVLLIGFSRVYLGMHWVTDVLGGYALGAVWLAVVLATTSAVRGAWRRRRAVAAMEAGAPMTAPTHS